MLFDIRQGLIDQQGRDAVLAEGAFELLEASNLHGNGGAALVEIFMARLEGLEHFDLLACCAHLHVLAVFLLAQIIQVTFGQVDIRQCGAIGLVFLIGLLPGLLLVLRFLFLLAILGFQA